MRRWQWVLFVSCMACSMACGPVGAEPIVLDDSTSTLELGLVGYWKLDETDPDATVLDSSGFSNHGAPLNRPLPDAAGAPVRIPNQGSRAFNGVDQLIDLGNPEALNFGDQITLAAWVHAADVGSVCEVVIGHGYRLKPSAEVSLRRGGGVCGTSGMTSTWAIGTFDGVDHFAQAPLLESDLMQWTHVAGSYDGRAWRLYRNGMEVASLVDGLGAFAIDAEWGLGGRAAAEPSGDQRPFSGRLDEVRIYNRALSAPELLELYQL